MKFPFLPLLTLSLSFSLAEAQSTRQVIQYKSGTTWTQHARFDINLRGNEILESMSTTSVQNNPNGNLANLLFLNDEGNLSQFNLVNGVYDYAFDWKIDYSAAPADANINTISLHGANNGAVFNNDFTQTYMLRRNATTDTFYFDGNGFAINTLSGNEILSTMTGANGGQYRALNSSGGFDFGSTQNTPSEGIVINYTGSHNIENPSDGDFTTMTTASTHTFAVLANVPEPSSAALSLLGSLAVFARRKRS